MIPVQPFIADFYCQKCRDTVNHTVQFMSYDSKKHIVNFMATCCDCEEEAEDETDIIGFTASLPAQEWNKITPVADEIVFN